MLFRCEQLKKYIVLRAKAQERPDRINILEHVDTEGLCLALGRLEKPSQHGDSRSLAGTVVPKKNENLISVEL